MLAFIRRRLLAISAVCLFSGVAAYPAPAFADDLIEHEEMSAALKIGRATAAALLQGNVRLFAPEVHAQVQQLVEELARAAGLNVQLRVHIINSSLVNLLTFPSGDIILFSGFLDIVANRDELAFGLAHEIAHLRLNHGLNQMKKTIDLKRSGALISAILANMVASAVGSTVGVLQVIPMGPYAPLYAKGVVEPVSELAARLAARIPEELVAYIAAASLGAYSRAQEEEADRLGLVIMKKAGYDPAAALRVMEKLSDAWHTR